MIEDRLDLSTLHLASLITEVSIPALLKDDPAAVEFFFEELENRTDILSVAIVDRDGWLWMDGQNDQLDWLAPVTDPLLEVTMETGVPQQELNQKILHRAEPIRVADDIIGYLILQVSGTTVAEELRGLWMSTAAIGLAFLLVGPVLAGFVSRRLSEPLKNLQIASMRVAEGNFDHRIQNDSNDEFDLVAASFNNMLDELNQSFLETKRVAFEDKLTSIPNRSWLNLQLENLVGSTQEDVSFSALFFDIDRFKAINDTHGHHAGDLLLRCFSNRVHECLHALGQKPVGVRVQKREPLDLGKGEALFARLAGDEFTLLVRSDVAERMARAIIEAMSRVCQLDGLSVSVSSSIGIAHFPEHAATPEHLLKCADVAMYQAKNTVRGSYAVYDADKHRQLLAHSRFEKDIEEALERRDFDLFLQPKFDVATNEVTGAEALIRWVHHERGNIPPDAFLPVAAGMGLLPRIGELMLDKAVAAAAAINARSNKPFIVAVNTASEELLSPHFAKNVQHTLAIHGLHAGLLEVEITEGTAMEQSDIVKHNLDLLQELGVSLAIDDFGIGYSNLGRLKSMAFDTLKIDRSLLLDVTEKESSQDLFKTVLDMATVLHADVVSEGVETESQRAFLKSLGVKTYQGYLGARPMPLDTFWQWLEDRERGAKIA
ncbi:putative bifunctional diguanylate cyclase/phosphodiesterase [Amaricoccus macauensis]|uniref:putative bifunctional diguanylate cyclase/phosphodiesterase n=1 Tax=Amaricoccus macauensis TaxID=57001 RepID=UPI003C7BFF0A